MFEDTAIAANGPYPPNTWSYAKDLPGYPLDLNKAKSLLAKAGLAEGFNTTIWTRPSGSLLNPNPSLGAQMLQPTWPRSASRPRSAWSSGAS